MRVQKKTPVLKWAGGKTQLLEALQARMPEDYGRYYEPFIGGGALFLAVSPADAVINDTNEQLINLYRQLKLAYGEIIAILREWDRVPCDKEGYLAMRARYNRKIEARELDAECAALMIWINKHCFNGLYRVNGKGLFNVPYNNRTGGPSMDEGNLTAIGEYLQTARVEIVNQDFEEVCRSVSAGDFVYFDSPYVPVSETSSFTDYTKDGFALEDHERLARLFRRLDGIGAKVMLSNNDVDLVWKLYEGYHIQRVEVKRLINRVASKRTGREVIITNY